MSVACGHRSGRACPGRDAYDTQYIELGEALDGLLDPVRATEDGFLKGIYADFSEQQRWSGLFQTPLTTTIVSAGYGGRRSYKWRAD